MYEVFRQSDGLRYETLGLRDAILSAETDAGAGYNARIYYKTQIFYKACWALAFIYKSIH